MPRQQQALTMKAAGYALMVGLRGIIRKSAFRLRKDFEESHPASKVIPFL